MNMLCVGDVIGTVGTKFLARHLPAIKRKHKVDITIVNGENSADTNGITPQSAEGLFNAGADCVTGGNHSFKRKEALSLFEGELSERFPVLRPANYPSGVPGSGVRILDLGRVRIGVINLMGQVFMPEILECPFKTADRILKELESELDTKIIIVDFHAEATSEKRALANYLDGRVSVVFGTHTHVQTADEQVLPGGTGFITDAGMTGPVDSVIGCRYEAVLSRFLTRMPARLDYADGACVINAVLFGVDEKTGRCLSADRIRIE